MTSTGGVGDYPAPARTHDRIITVLEYKEGVSLQVLGVGPHNADNHSNSPSQD